MTINFPRLGYEDACRELQTLGFEAVEIFVGQIGPGVISLPLSERHGEVVARHLREIGLEATMLNAIDGNFEPLLNWDESVRWLARTLRLAHSAAIPRVLIWDGQAPTDLTQTEPFARLLAEAVEGGRELSGLAAPPTISVELHPFTFALQNDLLVETAMALSAAGAGICLDFCHFAVARGARFTECLEDAVLEAINYVHWCDSDCSTDALHMAPGAGRLDLDAVVDRLAGRGLVLAWDLFAWPTPRAAIVEHLGIYEQALERCGMQGLER